MMYLKKIQKYSIIKMVNYIVWSTVHIGGNFNVIKTQHKIPEGLR